MKEAGLTWPTRCCAVRLVNMFFFFSFPSLLCSSLLPQYSQAQGGGVTCGQVSALCVCVCVCVCVVSVCPLSLLLNKNI